MNAKIAVLLFVFYSIKSSLAFVSSCYSCSDCGIACDGVSCNSTVACVASTGNQNCFVAQRRADNKWDQGCATGTISINVYSIYTLCDTNNCNLVNGLSCYLSTSSTRPNNNNSTFCDGVNNLCYVALDRNNNYNQGCGTMSFISSSFSYSRSCNTSNCNTAALSCYSCTGCTNSSTTTICSSPNDELCYVGYRPDGAYDMGCGKRTTDLSSYKKSTNCTTDFCNLIKSTNNDSKSSMRVSDIIINICILISVVFIFLN